MSNVSLAAKSRISLNDRRSLAQCALLSHPISTFYDSRPWNFCTAPLIELYAFHMKPFFYLRLVISRGLSCSHTVLALDPQQQAEKWHPSFAGLMSFALRSLTSTLHQHHTWLRREMPKVLWCVLVTFNVSVMSASNKSTASEGQATSVVLSCTSCLSNIPRKAYRSRCSSAARRRAIASSKSILVYRPLSAT